MALIDLQNISKHYSAQKILTDVNFHVYKGERIVIIGKNERITKNDLEVKILDKRPNFKDGQIREAVLDGLRELNEAKSRYEELSLLLMESMYE